MAEHKNPPFVMVNKEALDTDAWRAMSMGARVLYIALRRRFRNDRHNNGRIFLSQRDAAKEIGRDTNQITRWFRELQHFGFIVQTKPGWLGLDGVGRAPHWRLTECGYMKEPATQDYLRWDGTPFKTPRPKKQNPVREITDAHVREKGDTAVRESTDIGLKRRPRQHGHTHSQIVRGSTDISSIPSTSGAAARSSRPRSPPVASIGPEIDASPLDVLPAFFEAEAADASEAPS
jgi:hypothetical protein